MTGPRAVFVTTDTTAQNNDLILANATSGALVITLPSASWGLASITVKKTDASVNTVTVTRAGTATIDGATTYVLSSRYDLVEVVADGTNWNIVSGSVATTSSATAPSAPTIGTATAGDTTATANWTAPGSNGGSAITGYQVKTYDTSGTLLFTDTTGVVLTFTKTGLTNGTAYKFKVAAINAVGTGSQSAFSNTVTPAAAFDITTLSDIYALWRSTSITGLADNDPIATVPDDSGLSHAATASGSLRPTYKTGILNGHSAIRYTGTQGLTSTSSAGQIPISVFAVATRTSSISGECCIRGAAATGGVEFRHTAGGALHIVMPNIADIATSTSNPFNTSTGINVPKIVGFTYDGSTYAFYDGTTQIGTGSSSHSGSASNTNLGYDTVGGDDLFIIGDVFEHLEVARVVTSGEISDIVSSWQTKFGI